MKGVRNNKGFVVSAVLYPLLVLFLALIMGLLAMSDTRKRILDKMKLEISDSIFDDAECSCDTILNKLNYLIKNGVGGGGGGSYSHNVLGLNVKGYETEEDLPNTGNAIGDIGIITDVEVTSYYVSRTAPADPKDGNVWIVEDRHSDYYIKSDYSNIGISYAMQYIEGKWVLKKAYVFDDAKWKLLYYVSLKDGIVDMTSTDINAEIIKNFGYKAEEQIFSAVFSGYYQIELWGAQGGAHGGYAGGNGAYTKGEIYLNAGDILYIYTGGTSTTTSGGWNGGGDTMNSPGGGGATDIRLQNGTQKTEWNNFESLKSRIMVAAGGGSGFVSGSNYGTGGAGGGLSGYACSGNNDPGTGGTQSLAGYDSGSVTTAVGGFGYGGKGTRWGSGNGSGGGGWYGGGGGYASGGGGGSSYISGHEGCNSIEEESTSLNIIHNGSAYHYSGYYFINTDMKSGINTGNGKAKITLITVEIKTDADIKEIQLHREKTWTYTYSGTNVINGRDQVLIIPEDGEYQVELWGAQGGNYGGYAGGLGAYTLGTTYFRKNTKLYIYVGGTSYTANGGWNGGGDTMGTSGGGGATDIRLIRTPSPTSWNEFNSLKSRIMVAAGGGSGFVSGSNYGTGGAGGGLSGYACSGNNGPGTGGTQSLAGYDSGSVTTAVGGFGYGGKGTRWGSGNGSGGGGYYGGGGGYASGGGGGSSYISGHAGCNSIEEESNVNNIIHNGSAYHYSGYYFTQSLMTAGVNSNHGRAKITKKSTNYKSLSVLQNEIKHDETIWNYTYSGTNIISGRYQVFNVTKSGTYRIQLWGAQGGNYGGYAGGLGGYTYGEIYLPIGDKIYVYVGGTSYTANGGWNGGGDTMGTPGGGGATDVRTIQTSSLSSWNETDSLRARIMVAGGGGSGFVSSSNYGYGGAGGGLNGYTSSGNNGPGTGGTQVAGGYDSGSATTAVGGFGYGGKGTRWSGGNASGGSGWYGGGGGYASGGGGGSSYISGHAGCIGIDSNGNKLSATYTKLADSYSHTGYIFDHTQMIDGQGYPWTTSKAASSSGQPNNSGGALQTGQSGNGYAKITYLGA